MYSFKKIYGYFNDRFILLKNHLLKNHFNRKKYIHKFFYLCEMFNYLAFPFGKKAYVIGTPEYKNLGDSAICLAEMNFLHKSGFSKRRIKEISTSDYFMYRTFIRKYISRSSLICGMGGGNMGNHWYDEELLRYEIINDFKDNHIIIFPQTIFYTDDESGKKAKKESVDHYNSCKKLCLIAREKNSFSIMKELYKEAEILLTPDIVLSTNRDIFDIETKSRRGILLCMRSDKEKILSETDILNIETCLHKNGQHYKFIDMYSECDINKKNRLRYTKKKLEEFASSRLVITDRLHAMIFAAITETPCIVFDNVSCKISGTYEWIKYLDYIKYVYDAGNIDYVQSLIEDMLNLEGCKFDNEPLCVHFNKISEVIKSYAN